MRMVTKLTGWLYPERSFHPSISITTQWGGLVRLLDIVNNCISAITMHMVTKLFTLVAHHEEPTTINSHDSLVMWSCEVRWQFENFIFLLSQDLWSLNLAGCWDWEIGSAFKPQSCHQLLVFLLLFFILLLFFDGLAKVVCGFLFYCCFRHISPVSDLLT